MNHQNTTHAWWSRLRHQGLLLSPVVMLERFPAAPEPAPFHKTARLRDAYTRFVSAAEARQGEAQLEQSAILAWTDALLENYVGHGHARLAKQHNIPENLTAVVRIGTRSDTIRPHRVVFADDEGKTPALLMMADTSNIVGRGRGRTVYSRFLELLRGTGHRLGLLTNGHQFRLVYAGLDFESWCEWESDRWFDDGEGNEELNGLRQLLSPDALKPTKEGTSGLLDAVEESRKRQADLSSVLRENVRQAVELLLDEVSSTNRTEKNLFAALVAASSERPLTDAEAHEALLQATVRVVMRLVVCLFAESRQLLPVDFPIYTQAYGVRSLYELLEEATRNEGGTHGLLNRNMAWPRLMALFRLIYGGSAHGGFPMRAYGGVLFRPGDTQSDEPVARALHILEHGVGVCDATIYHVLRKLLRGPLPVLRGRAKTFVEGPVDYTDLRTEFIGLIYEGLLDYRLKRTDEKIGPQVFLNLGREPVLPLARLEDMLAKDKKVLKDLLTTLRKEKVIASAATEEEESEEEAEEPDESEEATALEEPVVEAETTAQGEGRRAVDYLDAVESAKCWAREAVKLAALVSKQGKRETDSEYQTRIDAEANRLIKRVVATGEFYLVRAGNTRKGTGTFYTRPQLAVPTVHRTLEPLCYDISSSPLPGTPGRGVGGEGELRTQVPKEPEIILGLKVCDPSCGSASFLVAALHYMTDALFKSLCHHRKLDDPEQAKKLTLPYGRPRTTKADEELVPFPPNDPQRGDTFADRIKALLRRHVVERCIYGVDINPLAVEFARVSLWVETLDPELPFSFLDHKIKVGNSLVGCWLDRVLDYPLKAWEREGGDGKDGPRTQAIETFLKGEKVGNKRSGDGRIKREMRAVIESRFSGQPSLFDDKAETTDQVVAIARNEYESLHNLPIHDTDEREQYYREHVEGSPALQQLKQGMDEWCAIWFWPTEPTALAHVPTPQTFHEASAERAAIVQRLSADLKFFHWELAFPDVFTPQRCGFDAMIGNPPWENLQPNPQEFFSEYDPLFRTYSRIDSLRRMKELFSLISGSEKAWLSYCGMFRASANWFSSVQDPFGDSTDAKNVIGKNSTLLHSTWRNHRSKKLRFAASDTPFRHQVGRVFTYKLFLEQGWFLLQRGGRFGQVVPTNLYSDLWSLPLRSEFISHGSVECLYAFQNEKRVFEEAHHAQKQLVLIVSKGGTTLRFLTAFRFGVGNSPQAWEIPHDLVGSGCNWLSWTPHEVGLFSPHSQAIAEIGTQKDLDICRVVYCHAIRIGDKRPDGGSATFSLEFLMNTGAKYFPPREKWEAKCFKADEFCRWIGPNGDLALPLYEGRMVGQFDFSQKGWLSGKGRTAVWKSFAVDRKIILPQYLMSEETYREHGGKPSELKVVFMRIGSSTNERTMIGSVIAGCPCGDTVSTLRFSTHQLEYCLFTAGAMSSLTLDYVTRQRVSGLHLDWHIVSELPIPGVCFSSADCGVSPRLLVRRTAQLTFLHRRFAPEWLRLKHLFPDLATKEWKHWWAVTEADRLRLRVEIDAIFADLYGLEPDDYDWIVRDDPTDPKGFYRVDRKLPFRERLTGLAAAAFRALKEGKWSAETAAKLTNDEFFEIIGIPELTNPAAAKANNLPEPLILKRDGCHKWEPEKFLPTDPRYGWTWNDCWKDAVALLGSEKAVKEYVGKKEQAEEKPTIEGAADLFGQLLPPEQGRMF